MFFFTKKVLEHNIAGYVPVKQCVISNTAIQSPNVLDDPYIEIHRSFNLLDGFA